MADEEEKIEEIKVEATKTAAPAAPTPWIPIIVLLIAQPVIIYVVVAFFIMPKIEHAYDVSLERMQEPMVQDVFVPETMYQFPFENLVANIAGSFQSRYVKVSFTVAGSNPSFEQIIFENQAKLEDSALGVLSSMTLLDFEQPGVQNIVRSDLLIAFENSLGSDVIKELYFSEFVVQ